MKKLLSSVLAAAMMVSVAAFASADEATIPLYISDLDIPALQEIPGIATEFDASKEITTLWASTKLDWANVNAYVDGYTHQIPLELNEDGTSATYSSRNMKRQVGVWWHGCGSWTERHALQWWKYVGKVDKEADAVKQIVDEYVNKGYTSTDLEVERVTQVVSDVYNFYVDVNGSKKYVGFYDYDSSADADTNKANAENVINYLAETQGYNPDALTYERKTTTEDLDFFNVFLKSGEIKHQTWNSTSGDDAYYVGLGTQTSVHGRDGSCHTVYAWTADDLFNTDMECTGTTVTWKKNGNTGDWYPASVSGNYANAFTTNITAYYSPNVDQSLEGYTVIYNDKGVVYTVDYNAYGSMEVAKAVDLNGVEFKSAGSSTSFDWVNTATSKFMRNFSLLSLSELQVTLVR